MRFFGLGLDDTLADATTVRLFQDALAGRLDQDAVRALQIVKAEPSSHRNDESVREFLVERAWHAEHPRASQALRVRLERANG